MTADSVLLEECEFAGACEHPWLCIERLTRALIGERIRHRPSHLTDLALVAVIAERDCISRAGWFN